MAISLLSNEIFCQKYLDYAESLLLHFVENTKNLYGPEYLTYNFHNLLHISDDVRTFGCIENFSNFSFENYLHFKKVA